MGQKKKKKTPQIGPQLSGNRCQKTLDVATIRVILRTTEHTVKPVQMITFIRRPLV